MTRAIILTLTLTLRISVSVRIFFNLKLTLGPSHTFIVIMDLVPAPPPATGGTRKVWLPATGRARQGNVRQQKC